MEMEIKKVKSIIEAMLFVSGKPVEYNIFKNVLEIPLKDVREAIEYLNKEYEDKGSSLAVIEIAEGFQLITRPEYSYWLKKMFGHKKVLRLPATSLETLAIIAYKQPITKAEIDEIRGVNSDGVIKNLLSKKMIKIVGRKEVIGRPLLYGTTKEFLEYFGLRSLNDLPDENELNILLSEKVIEEEDVNEVQKIESANIEENEINENDEINKIEESDEVKENGITE
ncbi:MAG TPA: SMC-Scp complex subunit ScpB [bacterium]|nr:SMC-Scp complex subunit ScpB [bacterium]HOL47440.1 SMC-Scp complex subunit ScpB [bacterium]HPQ19507.1 SMC-Scp complex subunit ScpB [bacterium]